MTDLVAVNPSTGEVLENLEQQPPADLCDALDAINTREAQLKAWRAPIETELRRRLNLRQTKLAVFGDWEVEATVRRESVWDADQLEATMRQLVDDGTVTAGDLTGVITREPVVSRSKARDLAKRLDGVARELVNACCTWREKPGRVTVTRSVVLEAGEGQGPSTPVSAGPTQPPTDLEELFRA